MSNEKPLHQKSAQGKITRGQIHSVEHLACTVAVQNSERFRVQCRSSTEVQSHAHSALGTFLAAFSSCLEHPARALGVFPASVAPLAARAGVSCGSQDPVTADRGQERRLNAVPRRPSPLCSPRGLMRASARPWHRRRGPASTERAHCRRRARAAPFCRTPS